MNFRVLLALSASLVAFNSMAADCIDEICVGEKVLDPNGRISVVAGLDTNGRKVQVKDSNSTLREFDVSEVSDEIESPKYPVGKLILDESNIQGTVKVVFRNGVIIYRRNNYPYDSSTREASPEVTSIRELKAGTNIIDDSNIRGSVNRLFQNGTVFYRRNNYPYDTATKAENLILRVDSKGQLTKGTPIIDDSDIQGKVTDLYADGRTFYLRNNYSYETMANFKDLTLKVDSLSGLSSGTSIIDSSNIQGSVTNLYQDGRVFYRRKNYSYDTLANARELVKEVQSYGDIKVGTKGLDESNNRGQVLSIFADGRMFFQRLQYSYATLVTKIYTEVDTHKQYSKDVTYASNYSVIGKPTAFYSNGMVLLNDRVVDELYEAVSQFENVTVDSEVQSIDGKSVKIKELYANGLFTTESDKKLVGTVVNYNKLSAQEKKSLSGNLAQELIIKASGDNYSYFKKMFFQNEEMAEVKKDVLATLNKSLENTYADKESIKKAIKLLKKNDEPTDVKDPEEYSLSVSPADIIDEVKAVLDQEQKKYIIVSPATAKSSSKSIIIDISKGLLKSTCSVEVKEKNEVIKSVNKKISKSDNESCLNELKN